MPDKSETFSGERPIWGAQGLESPTNPEEVTMSKRKIRRKNKASKKGRSNGVYMSSFLAMKDADSGEIQFRGVAWKVEEKEMHYMPI